LTKENAVKDESIRKNKIYITKLENALGKKLKSKEHKFFEDTKRSVINLQDLVKERD
jgi:hypothetical protein